MMQLIRDETLLAAAWEFLDLNPGAQGAVNGDRPGISDVDIEKGAPGTAKASCGKPGLE